ncbi:50S ribosomal protein L25 [Lacrimispora saccharolytica]|nr:50S ribosomal protein L25 [Lacrimispora saccharolytica]
MNTLKAEKRDLAVKAKKLRREGYVTGNVFGKELEQSIPVKMLSSNVESLLKTTGKGGRILLDLDGQSYNVLIKEVDFNSMKHQITEIDFQVLVAGEKVHSVAEIELLNHDKVTNGVIQLHLEEISYRALPEDLTDRIQLDLDGVKVGDSIKVKDLPFAQKPQIELLTDPESIVVSVTEVRNTEEAETEEEAAE